jgi:hypothetical protein
VVDWLNFYCTGNCGWESGIEHLCASCRQEWSDYQQEKEFA